MVPLETTPTNTSMVVPSASELVPLTEVASIQIGELTTGASELVCTVTPVEAALWHFPDEVALAVIDSPATKAGDTVTVQEVPVAVPVPILDPFA